MTPDWRMGGPVLWELVFDPAILRVRCRAAWRDGELRWLTPRLPERLRVLDVAPLRNEVDLTLSGFAYPKDAAKTRGSVSVEVGEVRRLVAVSGPRVATVKEGAFAVSHPAAFERLPLQRMHAYGGESAEVAYPRNPLGKGFILAGVDGEFELPELEEAEDLLTDSRLIVPTADDWWRQPLPATFDESSAIDFPRPMSSLLVAPASRGSVESEPRLPELRTGDLTPGFRVEDGGARHFLNAVPMRSRLAAFRPGDPFAVSGCDADGKTWAGKMPRVPGIELELEGSRRDVDLHVQSVELATAEREVRVTMGFDVPLPRPFLPGLHKRIPISVRLEGHEPIAYPTPPTLRDLRVSNNKETRHA